MAKRTHDPVPPLNELEKRNKEYGSQNMRMFYTIWNDVKNRTVRGPSTEETRQRALVELVKLKRRVGGGEIMVNSYISVAPNYFIYPYGDYIVYELGFDMYFVVPVGNTERMYESNHRDKVAGFTRLNKVMEMNVSEKFMPKGLIRVPLGRVTQVDLNLKKGLGRIRAGKISDYTCFDIQFSLDETVQNRIDFAKLLLEDRIVDDISKEEKVNDW